MNARHRLVAVGLAGVLALTACGGESAPGSAPSTTASSAGTDSNGSVPAGSDSTAPVTDTAPDSADGTSTPTTASDGEPVPTIAPDVPEEFLDAVGPVAVIGDALPPFPEQGVDPAVGMIAPVLIGETTSGEPVRVDAAVDGPTWIVFLAHWCPHCNDEIPRINQLRDEGRIPDGLNVVGVSTAYSPDRPNWPPDEWLVDKKWTFTAINDGIDMEAGSYIAAKEFGIGGFPFSILVDGDGVVITRWSGERLVDELATMLSDNVPPT